MNEKNILFEYNKHVASSKGFGFISTNKIVVKTNWFEITGQMFISGLGRLGKVAWILIKFFVVIASLGIGFGVSAISLALLLANSGYSESNDVYDTRGFIGVIVGFAIAIGLFSWISNLLNKKLKSPQTILIKNEEITGMSSDHSHGKSWIRVKVKSKDYGKGKIICTMSSKISHNFEEHINDILSVKK